MPSRNWGQKTGVNKAHKLLGTLRDAGTFVVENGEIRVTGKIRGMEILGKWIHWEKWMFWMKICHY